MCWLFDSVSTTRNLSCLTDMRWQGEFFEHWKQITLCDFVRAFNIQGSLVKYNSIFVSNVANGLRSKRNSLESNCDFFDSKLLIFEQDSVVEERTRHRMVQRGHARSRVPSMGDASPGLPLAPRRKLRHDPIR